MPYTLEHKLETRKRIIDSARLLFNAKGFDAVRIKDVMLAANLTHGGFYNHFSSKDELFVEAVKAHSNGHSTGSEEHTELCVSSDDFTLAKQLIDAYLSEEHLVNLNTQCAMISLPSDIARASKEVKVVYESMLENMTTIFEGLWFSKNSMKSRQRALGLAALCVGGMILARTVDNGSLSEDIRKAAHDMAVDISNNEL